MSDKSLPFPTMITTATTTTSSSSSSSSDSNPEPTLDVSGTGNDNLHNASVCSSPPTLTSNSHHTSFRRQRASRACETCHARKVRCDAASLGVPCTNCVAFSIECKIPTPKRKRNQLKPKDLGGNEPNSNIEDTSKDMPQANETLNSPVESMSEKGMPPTTLSSSQAAHEASYRSTYTQFMKPRFARAPIKEAGRVAYLGESSNLSLLVHDRHGMTDVVHYPLPETIRGTRARQTDLDHLEIKVLHQRGAFLLPPRNLCDELVGAFFKWVAPVVPIINRSRFMRRYRDSKNPPSLLLLQAILLAGSRVCTNTQLMDQNGSTIPAAMTFYKRAKALYDANYEDDRVTIVQALVLMGWYWEGPEDVTKNVFYWTRVAIVVAQGSGMHRSVENSQLSQTDKRLWKRIWWTLFTRDRSVAVALGRPIAINIDDSDVEMLIEEDFIEDEGGIPAEFPPDQIHVQFFLQYVKLCEIMGIVLAQQYSVASKSRRCNAIDLTHSDMALADWLKNCPREVSWERSRHHFWSALLHSNYYTTLCLLHRAHMPPASPSCHNYRSDEMAYPSRTIAFQAAAMITSIIENLQALNEIRYTPAFIVYSLFSALIMQVYQTRSSVPSVVALCQKRIDTCMQALRDVSKVWLVAKMVHTLFESILGNKVLAERLQKAPGKRHQRQRPEASPSIKRPDPPKRKFDEMDLGLPNGGPTPSVSYERSRPQTPAVTPSRELGHPPAQQQTPRPASPTVNRVPQESYLGPITSRENTRPTSPLNFGFSAPATPPDLFLVTRNSPNFSHSLWENFQPDQLFPDGANIFPNPDSSPMATAVDPQLQMSQLNSRTIPQRPLASNLPQLAQSQNLSGTHSSPSFLSTMTPDLSGLTNPSNPLPMFGLENHPTWNGLDSTLTGNSMNTPSPDDSWSNSSLSYGPSAPTTLNVEDWFQFFGINNNFGDILADPI